MANPVLNEKAFERARSDTAAPWVPPIDDGPSSPYQGARDGTMTVSGAAWATAALFAVVLVFGAIGWSMVEPDQLGRVAPPAWVFGAMLVGFGIVILSAFKPHLARFTAPVYAVVEGLVVGVLSHVYDARYDGIVVQAVGATLAVFATMLVLYGLRIIRVTDRLRRVVIGATIGIAVFYGVALLFSLFGATPEFLRNGSALGILLSLVFAGVAAFNLALDFDLIEKGAQAGAPRWMEWYAALGLLVTIVWLYLEMLRLFANLRER